MVYQILKGIWKREIDSRKRPHQDKQETPEAGRAVQIPVEQFPIRLQVEREAAAPIRDAGPPDDEARETKSGQQNCADAVCRAASVTMKKIIVQGREPNDQAYHCGIGRSQILSRVRVKNPMQ